MSRQVQSSGAIEQRILALFDAFPRMQIDEVLGFFAPDAVYEKIPMAVFRGHDEIAGTLREFFVEGLHIAFEVRNLVVQGNQVFVERVTRVRKGDSERAIPIMAIFEVDSDGQVTAWRDYFDKAQAGLA